MYLAAKLMTIFVEYPIIFMGYSLSDANISRILEDIADCLTTEQIKELENRFIFIEYDENQEGVYIEGYEKSFGDKSIKMTKIIMSDYKILYKALNNKKRRLPVRILRSFSEELYEYTINNKATGNLKLASIADERVDNEELVLGIGKASEFSIRGLKGIGSDVWYRNIVLGDIGYNADDLLEYVYSDLLKQNSNKLPVYRYLKEAKRDYPEIKREKFDELISNTIKKSRENVLKNYSSVLEIWQNEKSNIEKATRLIAHLKEEQMDDKELENVLKEIFRENKDILSSKEVKNNAVRTNIRRLIRIYDYLKWGKEKSSN